MAFHYIQQGYFGDREYRALSRDEGYFSDFLWQLPQLSGAGVGRISLGIMAAESYGKFTVDECQALLTVLQAKTRVLYDNEWLWVVNYFKHKPEGSKWVIISARHSLQECESAVIVEGWLKKYGQLERVKAVMAGMVFGRSTDDIPDGPQPFLAGIQAEPAELRLHAADVDAVWIHYQKKMKSESFLTPKRRQKILERLRENIVEEGVPRVVTVEDLMRAISNCAKSNWHMGRDPKTEGHKYNSLEDHILVSQEKFLYWLTYEAGQATGPGGQPKGEVVLREETPSPSAKWTGDRTPPEEVKEILKRTRRKLDGPESKEQVFRG